MACDTVALFASFGYVFSVIGVAEGLRRWRGYPVEFTRKFIHVGVGMWAYGTVLLFQRRACAVIPPLSFVAINAFSYWRGTFGAMETGVKGQEGVTRLDERATLAKHRMVDPARAVGTRSGPTQAFTPCPARSVRQPSAPQQS